MSQSLIQPAGIALPVSPGGRLTLTTAVPVLSADVTAAATIYYTPYAHALMPTYDGTQWMLRVFAELSLALNSNSGHTGYHQSGKNFDVFVYPRSGTLTLATGPAWTSDIARADAVTRLNGIMVNNASIVLRYGSNSGDTESVAANKAVLVGTIRASANGQTQVKFGSLAASGGEAWIGISNVYNLVDGSACVQDSADSWSVSGTTYASVNASATWRFSAVRALNDHAVRANTGIFVVAPTGGSSYYLSGIGLDSTSVPTNLFGYQQVNALIVWAKADWTGLMGLGFHYLQALEKVTAGTATVCGDNGQPTITQGGMEITFKY